MSLFAAVSAGTAGERTVTDLQQVNRLLQAEYELARTGHSYMLIDLQEQRVFMKASGVVLQTWEIDTVHCWGRPAGGAVAALVQKTSFVEPERNVQVVDNRPVVAKPFNALELADMPTRYRLSLENGTVIAVSATPSEWFSRMCKALEVSGWYLARPLISNWNFLYGRPYNELALSLPELDARMLYWAFNEGMPCLIGFPADAPAKIP